MMGFLDKSTTHRDVENSGSRFWTVDEVYGSVVRMSSAPSLARSEMGKVPGIVRVSVRVTHPDLNGPLVMDFPCTDDDVKIERRARAWAMKMYEDVRLLDADVEILSKTDELTPTD